MVSVARMNSLLLVSHQKLPHQGETAVRRLVQKAESGVF